MKRHLTFAMGLLVSALTVTLVAANKDPVQRTTPSQQPVQKQDPVRATGPQGTTSNTPNTTPATPVPQPPSRPSAATPAFTSDKGRPTQSIRDLWDGLRAHPTLLGLATGLTALIIVIGVVVLYGTVHAKAGPLIVQLNASFFFWLGITYCLLLLLVAVVYNMAKEPGTGATVVGGMVPIAVPWFGALGAVTISLEGVFLWNSQWDKRFNYWHIGRPVFGAVLGIVAFFLFTVIVSAAGSTPAFLDPKGTPTATNYIVFYVVAFLVGYREETFRELIKRATDLILKPAPQPPPAPAIDFKVGGKSVARIQCPPAAGAPPTATVTVDIENVGSAALVAPGVNIVPVTPPGGGVFAITTDHLTGGGNLAPGQHSSVVITFTPPAGVAGPSVATLTVTGTNLSSAKTIQVTG